MALSSHNFALHTMPHVLYFWQAGRKFNLHPRQQLNRIYQTFLNWFLHQAMSKDESVEKRLKKLEQAVFKKKE